MFFEVHVKVFPSQSHLILLSQWAVALTGRAVLMTYAHKGKNTMVDFPYEKSAKHLL